MSYIAYTKDEMNIVESGVEEIQKVLMGTDLAAKRSLLFCLERYLNPYYGYELPFKEEVIRLLETVVVSADENDVIEDALELKQREPLMGSLYPKAEFYYNISLEDKSVCLIYIFGVRWGRCLKYPLIENGNDTYVLGEAEHIWAM